MRREGEGVQHGDTVFSAKRLYVLLSISCAEMRCSVYGNSERLRRAQARPAGKGCAGLHYESRLRLIAMPSSSENGMAGQNTACRLFRAIRRRKILYFQEKIHCHICLTPLLQRVLGDLGRAARTAHIEDWITEIGCC